MLINSLKEPESLTTVECAWLSPAGDIFPCGYTDHGDLADLIYKKFLKLGRNANPEFELEKLGWLKLSLQWYPPHERIREITARQFDVILEWCSLHKEKLPYWLTDDRQVI